MLITVLNSLTIFKSEFSAAFKNIPGVKQHKKWQIYFRPLWYKLCGSVQAESSYEESFPISCGRCYVRMYRMAHGALCFTCNPTPMTCHTRCSSVLCALVCFEWSKLFSHHGRVYICELNCWRMAIAIVFRRYRHISKGTASNHKWAKIFVDTTSQLPSWPLE